MFHPVCSICLSLLLTVPYERSNALQSHEPRIHDRMPRLSLFPLFANIRPSDGLAALSRASGIPSRSLLGFVSDNASHLNRSALLALPEAPFTLSRGDRELTSWMGDANDFAVIA
jgi:hypothetical protein